MPETQQLLMFMLAGVLLNLTPGPDVLYIVNQSLRGGVRPGLVAACGITAGCFVHVASAALGLGVILATSAEAFNAVKWTGAAYLLWMGGRLLLASTKADGDADRDDEQILTPAHVKPATDHTTGRNNALASERITDAAKGQPPNWRSVFVGAFATNALNPKVALFFLAFVPQFIPAQAVDPAWTFVLLGCLFNLNSLLVCVGWALAAAWLSRRTQWLQRGMRHLDQLAGLMFMGFGLKLALTNAPAP